MEKNKSFLTKTLVKHRHSAVQLEAFISLSEKHGAKITCDKFDKYIQSFDRNLSVESINGNIKNFDSIDYKEFISYFHSKYVNLKLIKTVKTYR